MFRSLIRGSVSLLKWVLCGIGVLALVVLALLATPLQPVPELQSISRARATVDLSSLPAVERFQARDGTWLGFRHYVAGGTPTGRVAIVIHGSSGSSGSSAAGPGATGHPKSGTAIPGYAPAPRTATRRRTVTQRAEPVRP